VSTGATNTLGVMIRRPMVWLGALILVGFGLSVVLPMLWLFMSSLKSNHDIFFSPFGLPRMSDLHWSNYRQAWGGGGIGVAFVNSVVINTVVVLVTTLLSAMASFALTRFCLPGRAVIGALFVAGLMIPVQLAVVPLFFHFRDTGLLGTRIGLILAYVGFGLPFGVLVLSGFFRGLPRSLEEAAFIDGASHWQVFWHVVVPLGRSALATVAIFSFLATWSEYFLAFMLLSNADVERVQTLPLALANVTLSASNNSQWGTAFAALVIMVVPMIVTYVCLQRFIQQGIAAGAVKG